MNIHIRICRPEVMTDRQIVQEIMRRLESRQKENNSLREEIKDLRGKNDVMRSATIQKLREEIRSLTEENGVLHERINHLMTNYQRYVS